MIDALKEGQRWRDGVYLVTAESSFEAELLGSKLKSEGIPCVFRYRGASNFMEIALGANTTQDIDIFVPEETLEKARDVIVPVPLDDDFDPEGE
ncbi:MAG: DUF2007 domain-containing protein [Anaerovoracaceae bacterium]|jgi:hypothetical protein